MTQLYAFVCLSVCLPNVMNAVYNPYRTEDILPSFQNTVEVWDMITILIFYYVSSWLIDFLKFIYASI